MRKIGYTIRNSENKGVLVMELVTVKELYKHREQYLDKEITVGGWIRSIRDSKTFGFIVVNDEHFLRHCRLFTMIQWRILQIYLS